MLSYFSDFRNLLALSEANPEAGYRTRTPALGMYQFTEGRLKDVAEYLGEKTPDKEVFLLDNDMQERFFQAHINMILDDIQADGLLQYEGQLVTGRLKYKKTVPINLYGIVAGAHLGGRSGVRNFLRSGTDPNDWYWKNGVKYAGNAISDYVAKFSDQMNEVLEKKKTHSA